MERDHDLGGRRPRRAAAAAPRWLGRAIGAVAASALVLCLAPVAHAVQIPFRNCLADSYRLSTPAPLQWTPLYADAVFDTVGESHNLRLTVWGNVSGSIERAATLPAAGDPAWTNDNETLGKILGNPEPNSDRPMATTLISTINVLAYRPYRQVTDFCETSLANGRCPLAPVFETSDLLLPSGLPSVNMTHDFWSSYAFTSFSAQFSVIYGDSAATTISCTAANITPDLGSSLTWMLTVLPVAVLVVVGLATVYASICSACGTADIFYWSSNFGRQPDLLRLVTPGFGDCLQYIQFVVLTGALTLDYPGFYQPITSKIGWSALLFNSSFVSDAPGWVNLVDGMYVANGTHGLDRMGQLVGIPTPQDIWTGMMVWMLVMIAAVTVIFQAAFLAQWLHRYILETPEEDLRSKNIPFSVGNVVRLVFGYFMLPVVALSMFQLMVAAQSPAFVVILAVITTLLVIAFIVRIFLLILRTKPRVNLFDDLRTLLMYGPLYNTYSDEAAPYALVPLVLTFVRGVAIGAVQPSGIAQLVLLAICEVIQVMTIHAFRPFNRATSMNAYHTGFACFRFISVMLMIPFVPSLGVDEGVKGWIGYVVLFIHACVLVLGFFLNALQKMVEVTAYVMGIGAEGSQTRGGFMRIFGARQLRRRMTRRGQTGQSRASHLSSTAMLDADEHSGTGYAVPGGHMRSGSAASLGGLLQSRQMSTSALDSDVYSPMAGSSSFGPGTPVANSGFSIPTSPTGRPSIGGFPMEPADPYYRPPRPKREMTNDDVLLQAQDEPQTASQRLQGRAGKGGARGNMLPAEGGLTRGGTRPGYGHGSIRFTPRTDYSTREVDFYYRVRGPALNSEGTSRKLGTGPADPTSPMALVSSWFRGLFGGKSKEKSKGFEVVRSSRMPPAMMGAAAAEYAADEAPSEGMAVAMGVLRHGPIGSNEDDGPGAAASKTGVARVDDQLIDVSNEPRDSAEGVGLMRGGEAESPRSPRANVDGQPRSRAGSRSQEGSPMGPLPEIPRKSSRRHSEALDKRPAAPITLMSPPPPLLRASHTAPGREDQQQQHQQQQQQQQQPSPASARPRTSSRSNPSGRSAGSSSVASRLPFERSASHRDGPSSTNSSIRDYTPASGTESDDYRGDRASFGHVARHNASLVDLDMEEAGGRAGIMSRSAEIVNADSLDSVGSRESSLRR